MCSRRTDRVADHLAGHDIGAIGFGGHSATGRCRQYEGGQYDGGQCKDSKGSKKLFC